MARVARRRAATGRRCCRAPASTSGRAPPAAAPRPRIAPGLATLGARLVAARRGRLAATVLTLGASTAFVLLLLALASALSALETDPAALGKRYQLTASLPAAAAAASPSDPRGTGRGAALRGPGGRLVLARRDDRRDRLPGRSHDFRGPAADRGHRLRGNGEAEVGAGLADALGLGPSSTLAIALPSAGKELRLRVAGVVSSLDHDGRVAYIPAAAAAARPTRRARSRSRSGWIPAPIMPRSAPR